MIDADARRSWPRDAITHRARVISDNDHCGDPDGLVQLAHHLLCPSVDLRLVIGSQVPSWDPFVDSEASAQVRPLGGDHRSARAPIRRQGRRGRGPRFGRSEGQLSAAAEAIVAEAMRDDSEPPLFMTCGGALTNVASAWRAEPRISSRLTVVWIGGMEHEDLAEREATAGMEHNTSIDLAAAQVVFNVSDLAVWQVPRNAYRQVLAARSELLTRMSPHGELGALLFAKLGGPRTSCRSSACIWARRTSWATVRSSSSPHCSRASAPRRHRAARWLVHALESTTRATTRSARKARRSGSSPTSTRACSSKTSTRSSSSWLRTATEPRHLFDGSAARGRRRRWRRSGEPRRASPP